MFDHRMLTFREKEVADLMAAGLSNQEIATSLRLSEGTVKVYTSRIYKKTGLSRVLVGRVSMAAERRRQLVAFNKWFLKWEPSLPPAAREEFRTVLHDETREVFFEGSD